jgi:hypothetical protein
VGYISKEELKTFEKNDTNLLGHPVINRNLGIDFSNGSLGMCDDCTDGWRYGEDETQLPPNPGMGGNWVSSFVFEALDILQ